MQAHPLTLAAIANNHGFSAPIMNKGGAVSNFVAELSSVLATMGAARQWKQANSAGPVLPTGNGSSSSGGSPTSAPQPTSQPLPTVITASPPQAAPASPAVSSSGAVTAYLLPPGSPPDANKPDLSQFMAATGTDITTASDVLYGTIGSNVDLRNWSAIMASSNPLTSAEASTAALYNSSLAYTSADAAAPSGSDLLAKSGNFEYCMEQVQPAPAPKVPMLYLCDSQGNQLRNVSSPQDLVQAAADFGFDTSEISGLQSQLDAAGINYRTGVWSNGFLPA